MRRLVACVNFADTIRRSNVTSLILEDISNWDLHNALQYVEMRRFLKSHGNRSWEKIGLCAQSVVACILSNVQGSDELWVTLAAHQLGKSKGHIRDYLERGNDSVLLANLLLANLTHITHKIFHALKYNREMAAAAPILLSLSKFDIRNTVPELQSSFLTLWHDIEHVLRDKVPQEIRDVLLNLYHALRAAQGTNDAPTRPSIVSPSAVHEAERHHSITTVSSHSTGGGRGRSGTSRYVVSHCHCNDRQHWLTPNPATNLGFGLSALLSRSPLNPLHFPHQKELLVFVLTLQALHPLIKPHPLIAHHDAQDLSDPIQMKSLLHRTRRQPGISVENRDPHLVPVWLESCDCTDSLYQSFIVSRLNCSFLDNVDSACNARQVARPLKHKGFFLHIFLEFSHKEIIYINVPSVICSPFMPLESC
jgi:hypothetical protein